MKLSIKELEKSFDKKLVFKNIYMELMPGELTGLVGRNGSGKTTLMQIIVTIMNQNKGTIDINGVNIRDDYSLLKNIIFIPDNFDYFKNYNIEKVLEFYMLIYENFNKNYFLDTLKRVNLNIKTRIDSLSKGQLTILGTIIGISSNVEFILIDEPYDGVDFINKKIMDELLINAVEEDKSVLISSHELDKLEHICNKIYYLKNTEMELLDLDEEAELKKFQFILKNNEDIDFLMKNNILILNKIGRVYTILFKGNIEDDEELFKNQNLVQFDKLNIKIEDIMVWNNDKEDRNEELY